jgi:hypothetical protein
MKRSCSKERFGVLPRIKMIARADAIYALDVNGQVWRYDERREYWENFPLLENKTRFRLPRITTITAGEGTICAIGEDGRVWTFSIARKYWQAYTGGSEPSQGRAKAKKPSGEVCAVDENGEVWVRYESPNGHWEAVDGLVK